MQANRTEGSSQQSELLIDAKNQPTMNEHVLKKFVQERVGGFNVEKETNVKKL